MTDHYHFTKKNISCAKIETNIVLPISNLTPPCLVTNRQFSRNPVSIPACVSSFVCSRFIPVNVTVAVDDTLLTRDTDSLSARHGRPQVAALESFSLRWAGECHAWCQGDSILTCRFICFNCFNGICNL